MLEDQQDVQNEGGMFDRFNDDDPVDEIDELEKLENKYGKTSELLCITALERSFL